MNKENAIGIVLNGGLVIIISMGFRIGFSNVLITLEGVLGIIVLFLFILLFGYFDGWFISHSIKNGWW